MNVVCGRGALVLTVAACLMLPAWSGCDNAASSPVGAGSGGAGGSPGADGSAGADGAAGADGGSQGDASPVTLTDQELAMAHTLSPLPASPPADTTNAVADDARAAALGQRLFFERGFSGTLAVGDDGTNGGLGPVGGAGRIACASCHAGPALDDRRSTPGNVSLGADFLTRNAPPLVNSSYYMWTNWAGRFSAQWELPIAVVENAKNMNGNRLAVAHLIFNKYRTDYEALFSAMEPAIGSDTTRFPASGKPKAAGAADGPWEAMTAPDRQIVNVILANFGKVLEAYMRKLTAGASAFDRYLAGEAAAMSDAQLRGLKLFVGPAKCIECHSGPLLSDNSFHNLGLAQTGPHVPAADTGRFADVTALLGSAFNSTGAFSDDTATGRLANLVTPPPVETTGQFRTPSLRNVAVTAPYMHAGQFATLAEVVDMYDNAGSRMPVAGTLDSKLTNLNLTPGQKADLVAYMQGLTSTSVDAALLVDTSAP